MAKIAPQTDRILHNMDRKIGVFGLVNYRRHPENKNYLVFNFNTQPEADLFEQELIRRKIWFEKDTEEVKGKEMFLFAVQEGSLDEVTKANGVVATSFKKPVIKNKLIRYSFLILFGLLIVFAIIGYVKNTPKVSEKIEQTEQDSL